MEEDKKLGMLFGLAMGDALGVPHEFYRSKFVGYYRVGYTRLICLPL